MRYHFKSSDKGSLTFWSNKSLTFYYLTLDVVSAIQHLHSLYWQIS